MDNIFDGINEEKFDKNLDQLTELVFKKLIERYGPIYPLNFGIDKEEILISELARLNTILTMLDCIVFNELFLLYSLPIYSMYSILEESKANLAARLEALS